MLINKYICQNEFDGEGGDLGGGAEPADVVEGGEAETPSYLFGDVTADEATERFGYLRDLPNHLRGLESRVSESVNPVMEQLKALGERIGSQPVFEPKLERFAAALKDYDPQLAEKVLPALIEDLKGSMNVTPIGAETVSPLVQPMLEAAQQQMMQQMIPSMLANLPFDPDMVVNRDPANPDNVLAPQTDLQKDFSKWWEQADAPTRRALGTVGFPYVEALHKFGKWRAELMRNKGKAAGDKSARLSGAAQSPAGGRRDNPSRKLESEEDGFYSVFAKRS